MKAVIFDMDGVIFDTELVWKKSLEIASKKFNLPLDDEYRQSVCGKGEELIRKELRERFPDLDIDSYRAYIHSLVNDSIMRGEYDVKPYFLEIVDYLKKKNYKIALATSSRRERAEKIFKNKNIDINIFDAHVFGDDVGKLGKPNPFIFNCAAKKLGFESQECFVIEDSINGLMAAVNGNFVPIMVIDLTPPNDYIRENIKYILNNLDEVKTII